MEKKTKRNMMVAAMLGGMGVFGYMYMKKNPNAMEDMKSSMKDLAKKTSDALEDME